VKLKLNPGEVESDLVRKQRIENDQEHYLVPAASTYRWVVRSYRAMSFSRFG
jgi:hypothetical protein